MQIQQAFKMSYDKQHCQKASYLNADIVNVVSFIKDHNALLLQLP